VVGPPVATRSRVIGGRPAASWILARGGGSADRPAG